MATIERLREIGAQATAHFDWWERNRNGRAPAESHFRINPEYLTVWISAVPVPLTPRHGKVRMLGPYRRRDEQPPTQGPDFEFYRRLLKFFEVELAHWAGQDQDPIARKRCWHAVRHAAASEASRLRWLLKIEPNQIEVAAFQDGLMGPGRRNGSRCSIETKNYRSIGPREQLRWRYVTWRLKRWLEAQGFTDRSDRKFEDPEEQIEWDTRQCWHFKGEETILAPRLKMANLGRDDVDADGKRIVNGDVKCFIRHGRIERGRVFHNINNMYRISTGGGIWWEANFRLFDWSPSFLSGMHPRTRRWMAPSTRIERLKRVLAQLVKDELFERAAKVRDELRSWERHAVLAKELRDERRQRKSTG